MPPEPPPSGSPSMLGYAAAPSRPRNRFMSVLVVICVIGVAMVWAGTAISVGVAEWKAFRDRQTRRRVVELEQLAMPSSNVPSGIESDQSDAEGRPSP